MPAPALIVSDLGDAHGYIVVVALIVTCTDRTAVGQDDGVVPVGAMEGDTEREFGATTATLMG